MLTLPRPSTLWNTCFSSCLGGNSGHVSGIPQSPCPFGSSFGGPLQTSKCGGTPVRVDKPQSFPSSTRALAEVLPGAFTLLTDIFSVGEFTPSFQLPAGRFHLTVRRHLSLSGPSAVFINPPCSSITRLFLVNGAPVHPATQGRQCIHFCPWLAPLASGWSTR